MSSDTSNEAAAARLRVALELFETGVEMKRQKLRRDHPDSPRTRSRPASPPGCGSGPAQSSATP
jgi:hypothetical protein